MRKKQYNYYRDQLLSFKEDEVEGKRKTLRGNYEDAVPDNIFRLII